MGASSRRWRRRSAVVGFLAGAAISGALVASVAGPGGLDGDAAYALLVDEVIAPLEAAGHDVELLLTITDPYCATAPNDPDTVWYLAARLEISGTPNEVGAELARTHQQTVSTPDLATYRRGGLAPSTWEVHVQRRQALTDDDAPPVTHVTASLGGPDVSDGPPGEPWCTS